jgi:hypothetical protein
MYDLLQNLLWDKLEFELWGCLHWTLDLSHFSFCTFGLPLHLLYLAFVHESPLCCFFFSK